MPKKGVNLTMVADIDARYSVAGQRFAHWLRDQYPRHTVKLASADLGVSPNTVKKWLAGVMPEGKHVFALSIRWGRGFLNYVFEPAIGADDIAARRRELDEIRTRLLRLEADACPENDDDTMAAHQSVGAGLIRPVDGGVSPQAIAMASRPSRALAQTHPRQEV